MMDTTDDIIKEVGGMSYFQVLMLFVLKGPNMCAAIGMIMMSFAGVTPDQWWCVADDGVGSNRTLETFQYCPVGENSTTCHFVYEDERETVISEWNLICGSSGIPPLITSVQMAGVLVGAFLTGQSADVLGRKKTFCIVLPLHAAFNLVAAFAVSWQMFIAMRFFIGTMVGGILVVNFPYFMEFLGVKWRPIAAVVPFWATASSLFALSCWLRPNWSHQHMILAGIHIPFLIGLFFAPESLRFLAVHGKIDKAEEIIDKIARYNKTKKPAGTRDVFRKIAEEEQKSTETSKKYTYLDIYKGWKMFLKSVTVQFEWAVLSFVYYGISFGVGSLSGNFYVNLFLVSIIEIPGYPVVMFLQNRIGRRWTSFGMFALAAAGAFGVVIATSVADPENIGAVTTTLALVCRFGVSNAWISFQIMTSELYPTTIRNLGYGAANTTARIGGIISPYAFAMGGLKIPFVIVGCLTGVCGLLVLPLNETMGNPLQDSLTKEIEMTSSLPREPTVAKYRKNDEFS